MKGLRQYSPQSLTVIAAISASVSLGLIAGYVILKKRKPSGTPQAHKKATLFQVLSAQNKKAQPPSVTSPLVLPSLTEEEMVKIKNFVINNFSPMLEEIKELRNSFLTSIRMDLSQNENRKPDPKKLTKIQVLDILKAATFSMVDFERAQIIERRQERRKKMSSEDYVKECLKSYTQEYLAEFEAKLGGLLGDIGIEPVSFIETRKRMQLEEILSEPTLESIRKLIHGKCMVPARILKETELEGALKFLISVFYTYASKPELSEMSFLFPLCCEDELWEAFGLNGEDVGASIFEYCKGSDQRLYPDIREYLRLFVKAIQGEHRFDEFQ